MAEEFVDWLDLPYHIVELIMNKLIIPEISNYINCGAVCTSWRTIFLDHPHPLPRRLQQPPLLIVPTPITENNTEMTTTTTTTTNTKSISFYNITHEKIYNQFQVTIPIDRHFRGSSHGWLVSVDEQNDCQVLLFNPFLTLPSSEILLPSLKHLPVDNNPCNATHGTPSTYAYLRKAVLSADPSSNSTDYVVMAIFGPLARLAYYRPGDEKWTTLAEFECDKLFRDVIYCNGGVFMALNVYGAVVVLDPRKDMEVTAYIPPPQFELAPYIVYLVESSAEEYLLQIHRITELGDEDEVTQRSPYTTTNFRVFKLCANDGGEPEWRVLKSLGDRTLFLGNNETISICASEYPGLKPNSIYFTDDNMDYYYREPWNGPHDLGIFNLEDGSIENHHPTDHETPIWPIPIWIEPSVQKKKIYLKETTSTIIKCNVSVTKKCTL